MKSVVFSSYLATLEHGHGVPLKFNINLRNIKLTQTRALYDTVSIFCVYVEKM
jgi:hypothetical protein